MRLPWPLGARRWSGKGFWERVVVAWIFVWVCFTRTVCVCDRTRNDCFVVYESCVVVVSRIVYRKILELGYAPVSASTVPDAYK